MDDENQMVWLTVAAGSPDRRSDTYRHPVRPCSMLAAGDHRKTPGAEQIFVEICLAQMI
jgi:hypothetical protein